MSSLEVDSYGIPAVVAFVNFFEEALEVAGTIKPDATVEPALEESDLEDVLSRLPAAAESPDLQPAAGPRQRNNSKFATIETAARGFLSNLISRISIDSPEFVKVWNFFDLLQCLSDRGQCDPALLVWLVEELLDSQTIPGCRKIFDYLESRRKRIISKNFNDKKLVILRSCNELLRRLSRAEDTAFSGRVFIFLFQSLPPGDKSSVNLRGEYHTQNVTTYDQIATKAEDSEDTGDKMEVDSEAPAVKDKDSNDQAQSKSVSFSEKKDSASKPLDSDALYPVFWSLQESFNQPKRLFEPASLAQFKSGMEATITAFKASPVSHDAKSAKQNDDKRGQKRRLDTEDDDDVLTSFNPKYLTSRDLFELEISDLSLRRYVLVQALIIMDFLLSLSPKAKEALASVQVVNKSVAYLDQVLSEDDVKWATNMKANITEYLKSASDGQFFLRMVETILSRDKNWVRWKIENCPLIERPPISPQDWATAMADAKSRNTSKRVRLNAMQPLSLDFLKDGDDEAAMGELKDPKRHRLPEVKSFKRGIQEAELEIDMPMSNASQRDAVESKASKTWRALRIASRTKLALFDKIDSYEDINILFEDEKPKEEVKEEKEDNQNVESAENGEDGENGQSREDGENGESADSRENGDKAGGGENGQNGENGVAAVPANTAKGGESERPMEDQNGTAAEAMVTDA